jgi:hypothetical protein
MLWARTLNVTAMPSARNLYVTARLWARTLNVIGKLWPRTENVVTKLEVKYTSKSRNVQEQKFVKIKIDISRQRKGNFANFICRFCKIPTI